MKATAVPTTLSKKMVIAALPITTTVLYALHPLAVKEDKSIVHCLSSVLPILAAARESFGKYLSTVLYHVNCIC